MLISTRRSHLNATRAMLLSMTALIALAGCSTSAKDNVTTGSITAQSSAVSGERKTLFSQMKKPSAERKQADKPKTQTKTKTAKKRKSFLSRLGNGGNGRKTLFGKRDPIVTGSVSANGNLDMDAPVSDDLAGVVRETLMTNPDVAIAAAQQEDARLAVEVEEAGRKPEVTLTALTGVENIYDEDTATEGVNRRELNVSVSHVLYDFGASKNAVKRREDLLESAKLRRADKDEEIALQVIEAYLNYSHSSELLAAAASNVAAHERILRIVALNEENGNATVADVKRVETRLEQAKSERLNQANAQEDAVAAFRRLTGVAPDRISGPKRLAPESKAQQFEEIEEIIHANPRLRSLIADRQSLEKQLKTQRAQLRPELFLAGEVNYKNDVGGDTGLGANVKGMVGVRVKLFDGGKRRRQAEQISARIDEAEARHRKLYRELLQQMEQNNQALSTGQEKTAFLEQQLAASNKAMNLYQQQFEAGERSAFELLDAQKDSHRAKGELINHRYEAAASVYRNLRLKGSLTEILAGLH